MLRLLIVAFVLCAASAADAQPPALSAAAKDALEEIKDVRGETEIDPNLPGRPVVGVKLRIEYCNPSTFKCLAHLDTIRVVTLWSNSTDKKEYDFTNLKPLAGLKGLKALALEARASALQVIAG